MAPPKVIIPKEVIGLDTSIPIQFPDDRISTFKAITGACVSFSFDSGISGCTCRSSDAYSCRKGTFYAGLTCASIISTKGACCLTDRENKTQIPCQESTFCGCYAIANSFNFDFSWNAFTPDKPSCKYFSCDNSIKTIGACCDGRGGCRETTEKECQSTNHFFQGIGTICLEGDKNICISGTGGCCEPGITCINGILGTDCIKSGKLYIGASKLCYEFNIDSILLPCLSSLPGYVLTIGDIVENSMVVGVYKPYETVCVGNPIFAGNAEFDSLVDGGETFCVSYLSSYDYNGYGNVRERFICDATDSYIILMSLTPLSYNDNYNFTWNNGGMAYGPLISPSGKIIETETEQINLKKEGYIYNTQLSDVVNRNIISYNSRSRCSEKREEQDTPEQRSFRNTEQNFNGRWSSDWGLHNTIRMVNAEIFYETGITYDSYLYSSLYSPSVAFGSDDISAITALRKLNKNTITVSDNISSWFIPSINELSFLADQCINNNLNNTIINNGGVPLNGEHWSSTGTFNFNGSTAGEGMFNGSTASQGSYAWSINFNGSKSTIKKDDRLIDKQIRPIRIVRCDGLNLKNSKNRLWWRINT